MVEQTDLPEPSAMDNEAPQDYDARRTQWVTENRARIALRAEGKLLDFPSHVKSQYDILGDSNPSPPRWYWPVFATRFQTPILRHTTSYEDWTRIFRFAPLEFNDFFNVPSNIS